MINRSLTIAIVVLVSGAFLYPQSGKVVSQKTYSESSGYYPRTEPSPSEKKKKTKKRDAASTSLGQESVVTVPVTVMNQNGGLIEGLEKADFKLFVDGIEITDFEFKKAEGPLNLFILIDTSPSLSYKITPLKDFVKTIVENMEAEDNIWIATFDRRYKMRSLPPDDRERAFREIRKLRLGEGTSVYDSMARVIDSDFIDVEGNKALMVITDGVDTISKYYKYADSLERFESHDLPVYPVYLNSQGQITRAIRRTPNDLIVRGLPPGINPPPTRSRNRTIGIGMSNEEYERGREYLDDVVRITGGRPFQFDVVSRSDLVIGQLVKSGVRPMFYLKFPVEETISPKIRKEIKVRVLRPDLQVAARGSIFREQ